MNNSEPQRQSDDQLEQLKQLNHLLDQTNLNQHIDRLYQFSIYRRWFIIICLWLTIGVYSLWTLRREIALWIDDFTWVAVRYALAYNKLAAIGLGFCLGFTLATLISQSIHILQGYSPRQKYLLEQKVLNIQAKGQKNFLYRWIFR
jgi:hypothetical protein